MDVEPKIRGKNPKWMVNMMEHPMNKWMIWGYHYFWKHPYMEVENEAIVKETSLGGTHFQLP